MSAKARAGRRRSFRSRSVTVDYGGTRTRVVISGKGGRVRMRQTPSRPISGLPSLLARLLSEWKALPASRLTIGAKGIWTGLEKSRLRRTLRSLADRVTVLSDVELAYRAAFKTAPGIVVLAGTGSIAYGKDASGKTARAGGLGPRKGDEGSGYWIGKTYLSKRERIPGKKTSVAKIASLAREVLRRAEKNDLLARKIIERSQTHLSRLATKVASRLRFPGSIPVSQAGGLFKSPYFRKGFISALKREFGNRRVRIVRAVKEPLLAIL